MNWGKFFLAWSVIAALKIILVMVLVQVFGVTSNPMPLICLFVMTSMGQAVQVSRVKPTAPSP